MNEKTSAFSQCHPAVSFAFFMIAILFCVIIVHPAYITASVCAAGLYCVVLLGARGLKLAAGMLPLFVAISAVNPLFNPYGETVLFHLLSRPYTLESLLYGMSISGMFVAVALWFFCYGQIMTSDKFTALFANIIPSISLLLVMVLRLIPSYWHRVRQITGARMCIGRGASTSSRMREKLKDGTCVLSVLTSWALESSVTTADSMRSRGYGAGRRTTFQRTRMTARDAALAAAMAIAALGAAYPTLKGAAQATFIPALQLAPLRGFKNIFGLVCYTVFLLIPTIFDLWEELTWRILTSKI